MEPRNLCTSREPTPLIWRKAATERREADRKATMPWTEAPALRASVEAKAAGNSYSPRLRPSSMVRRNGPAGV